ncbi:MAG: xanthine dehydrogenase family protein molybdopterin-binding subunit, partial [Chloroflexi bacterium]
MRRQEGGEKVTGQTRFTADLELPGLLHVHLVVSHSASARIRAIDTRAALSVPGVVDVVKAADLGLLNNPGRDLPLAADRVFYAGQPVVAVVAESEAAAEDAAALVDAEYDETPVVVEPSLAIRPDAAQVLAEDEAASEEDASIHGASAAADEAPTDRPPNVSGVAHL